MPSTLRPGIDFSDEAEAGVIASMLMDASCVAPGVAALGADDFCVPQNAAIFSAASALFLRNKYVDVVSVLNEMRRVGTCKDNTREYILSIADLTPTTAHFMEYVSIVQTKTILRHAHDAAESIMLARDPAAVQAAIETVASTIARTSHDNIASAKDLLRATVDWLNDPAPVEFFATGIQQLDSEITLQRKWLTIMAGFPGDGKTLLALQAACNMAKKAKVGYFFFESSKEDMGKRLLSHISGADYGSIGHKTVSRYDYGSIIGACNDAADIGLDIIEASGFTTAKIRAIAAAKQYDVVFVDYLQIVGRDDWKLNETAAISKASAALREMSIDLNCSVVALSQYHRTDDGNSHPTKFNLKGSSSIEQDAAIILLLSSAGRETWEQEKAGYDQGLVPKGKKAKLLQIAKNRHGEDGGMMYVLMDGAHQRFDYWNPRCTQTEPPPQEFIPLPDDYPTPFDEMGRY